MLEIKKGNLLDSDCQVLVNTINTRGAMGKGLALAFKQRYPALYTEYRAACAAGYIRPGDVWVWKDWAGSHWVFNISTKDDWRRPSQYQWIWAGLFNLTACIEKYGVMSVALPLMGCGNGGLDKDKVLILIDEFHTSYWRDILVEVWLP